MISQSVVFLSQLIYLFVIILSNLGWIRSATRYETCVLRDKWLKFVDMGWCQILESVLKDIDIIDRRLRNMIMNCSLLKCFWFQMNFRLSAWPFIVAIWCAPQSNKSSRAMRNETIYIPVREHWSERLLQWIKQNIIHNLKQYILLLILIEGDQGRFEVSKNLSPAMQTPNCLHSAT